MIEGLLTNPIILLLAASIIVMSLMFLFVGRKKKPKKKIEKAIKQKKESKSDEKLDSKQDNEEKEKSQEDDDFDKKIAQIDKNFDKIDESSSESIKNSGKKVTKIYVRKPQQVSSIETAISDDDSTYSDLSQRAEFVKTSKTVSKFGGFKTAEQKQGDKQVLEDAFKEEIENCDICKENSTHFDHSRRILKSVKNDDFDNLFANHITEHYLNINSERHLSSSHSDIFKRAEEVVQYGETRALDPETQEVFNNLKNDKDKLRFWFEQNRFKNEQSATDDNNLIEEEFDEKEFSLRYMMMAEALLKRKKKIKK